MKPTRLMILGALATAPLAAWGHPRLGFGFNFGFPLYDFPAPTRVVVIQQPAASEVVPPGPGSEYVWIAGHWEWDTAGRRYIWYGGNWQRPPAPNAVWQAGYWSQQRAGWVWVGAHWAVPNPAVGSAPAPTAPPPAPDVAPAPMTDSSAAPQQEVVVNDPPPAPVVEEVYASPGAEYVWVGGVWVWNGAWVWAPGHYSRPPFHGAVWVRGGWEARGQKWGWVRGRWR